MDGPLADFDLHLFAWYAEVGLETHCAPDAQCHRYSTDCLADPSRAPEVLARLDAPGWFDSLPPVPGAAEGLEALADLADAWIVTKPLESSRTCRDEKAAWVRRHLGPLWERRLVLAPDKALVRGSVLLDDAPLLGWLPRAEWAPVIYPTTWNGPGSAWAGLPRWGWGDDPARLLAHGAPRP
jgi:hypothetical protein